jgi:hypothetical protein
MQSTSDKVLKGEVMARGGKNVLNGRVSPINVQVAAN